MLQKKSFMKKTILIVSNKVFLNNDATAYCGQWNDIVVIFF